ncbi:MAG: tetratricopeptide repeat protein, partial [Candidatus Wallbacteria bacterium]|nr:tetratricopeptide repeat protein [Candidatus Wallbacteria bacterium]
SGLYYAGDTYGQLAVIAGLSNEKKADYYKKAITEFQRVIDDYPESTYAPSAYNSAGNACQTVPQMLTDKQEKIVFFERAIGYFKTLREKYYTFWASEGALLSMGSCHMKIGYGVHYTDYASQISAMEFDRENLEAAAALFRRFIGEYPGSSSIPTCRNFLGEALRNLADSFWTAEESTSGTAAYDESIAEFGTVAGDQSILYPYRISALEQIAVCGIRTARIYRYVTPDAKKHSDYCNEAIKALQQIIDNWPDQVYRCLTAKFRIGEAYWELGAYTESMAILDEVLNDAQASSYHKGWSDYFKGQCFYDMSDYAAADICFAEMEQIWGSAYQAGYARGRCYYQLEKYEDAVNALQKVVTVNVYPIDDLMQAEAFLFLGLCREKMEQYPEAFKAFAGTIVKFNEGKRFAGFVSQADAAIDRIVKIEIDQDDTFNNDGTVTVNLSARPVYADGNQFTIIGEHEWKWELVSGLGTLTTNGALARLETTNQDFGRNGVKIGLKLDLSAYAQAKNKSAFYKWCNKTFGLTPLENIINENQDYLVFDVEGYKQGKNFLYLDFVGSCDPIAFKLSGNFKLTLHFKPQARFDNCQVRYWSEDTEGNMYNEATIEFPIQKNVETFQDFSVTAPDKLGKYRFLVEFFYSVKDSAAVLPLNAYGEYNSYILYDAPKFEPLPSALMKALSFTKKNIDYVCTWITYSNGNIGEIAETLHKTLTTGLMIPYNYGSPSTGEDLFDLVVAVNKCKPMRCFESTGLMIHALNLLGIDQAKPNYIGATKNETSPKHVTNILVDGAKYEICVRLQDNEAMKDGRTFPYDAVCYLPQVEKCYNLAMQNPDVKGTYEDLRKPKSLMVEKYVWRPMDNPQIEYDTITIDGKEQAAFDYYKNYSWPAEGKDSW